MTERGRTWLILAMNTLSFTTCFAAWMLNGVLVTYLVVNGLYAWDRSQMAILIATPVLTGAVLRLPAGLLADRFGGRIVNFVLMLIAAGFLALYSRADSYLSFLLISLGFGISGASFAVGIAYTSVWFPKERQGTALGIFGAGNAGAALTTLAAPSVLNWLTNGGQNPEQWRMLPLVYAAVMAGMAVLFWLLTTTRVVEGGRTRTLASQMRPLKDIRVWRFGLYYFLVFGAFVALSQWLVPYYVASYGVTLAVAGFYASIFSLPSGVIRALCGWITDRIGARRSLYWTFAACATFSALLMFPEMEIRTPGEGVIATTPGRIVSLSGDEMVVENVKSGRREAYRLETRAASHRENVRTTEGFIPFPVLTSWQEWTGHTDTDSQTRSYQVGDTVEAKELLARGTTNVFFQANIHVFTLWVLLLGLAMGMGKAAVYKHIPIYFPKDVGAVGGLVGVIGGLGGFVCPILFGYLLDATGIWTTCWIFLFALSLVCLVWMHLVVRDITRREAPHLLHQAEHREQLLSAPAEPVRQPAILPAFMPAPMSGQSPGEKS